MKHNHDILLLLFPIFSKNYPPIGLSYLKSFLYSKGINSHIIDFNIRLYNLLKDDFSYLYNEKDESFDTTENVSAIMSSFLDSYINEWISEILQYDPKIIGVSLISRRNEIVSNKVLKKIKEIRPDIKIIYGGPRTKIASDKFLNQNIANYIIGGEGEVELHNLVTQLLSNQYNSHNPSKIKHTKSQDKPIYKECKDHISNLDLLPFPDYSDFDFNLYESNLIPILFSRGCIGNCSFCNIGYFWKGFRHRSGRNVYEEMVFQSQKYTINNFIFLDSLINGNVSELEKLCDLIIDNNNNFHWTANYRIKGAFPKRMFEKLSLSGCKGVNIGLESGSEKIRKDMNKPFDNNLVVETLVGFNDVGIKVHLMMVLGFPTENEQEFQKTIDFIIRYRSLIDSINFGPSCHLLKGSPIYNDLTKWNIVIDEDNNWENPNSNIKIRLDRVRKANEIAQECGIKVIDRNQNRIQRMWEKWGN